MSSLKKNVIQHFVKEGYIPTKEQFLVKYLDGKGNNLHEVTCVDGSVLLVSMPKKFRNTIWLKKNDCLVIDPIEEGNKVKGEIVCMLPLESVRDLITSRQWPGQANGGVSVELETLLQFFRCTSARKCSSSEDNDVFPPEDFSEMDTDEDGVEEESIAVDEKTENNNNNVEDKEGLRKDIVGDGERNSMLTESMSEEVDEMTRSRNRSRVQLVSSGIVTVTNVLTEGLSHEDTQSLEFEADEEEEMADEITSRSLDIQRHTNTIRIQVNYNNNANNSVTNHQLQ